MPAEGLIAHTLVSRFCDHMPYYRQETANARSGVHTPRATLSSWSGRGGAGLQPLYEVQHDLVDLDSIELVRPRSVGVEHAALSVMRECGFEEAAGPGLEPPADRRCAGQYRRSNILYVQHSPPGQRVGHACLAAIISALVGELIGFDFEGMDLNRLYRASDTLHKHRDALQDDLFSQAQAIFGLTQTVTLYELTHTHLEGSLARSSKAFRVHSKASHGRQQREPQRLHAGDAGHG
ncbi:IS66 family transposase, partial [Roseateles sp. GG27B]